MKDLIVEIKSYFISPAFLFLLEWVIQQKLSFEIYYEL